jgi:hypothetical protein
MVNARLGARAYTVIRKEGDETWSLKLLIGDLESDEEANALVTYIWNYFQ